MIHLEVPPATVICFSPFLKKTALENLNTTLLQYIFIEDATSYPDVPFSQFKNEAFYKINVDFALYFDNGDTQDILEIGVNDLRQFDGQQFYLVIEELLTINYGLCYKIQGIESGDVGISMFEDMITYDMTTPYIYITSEENSYGILDTTWMNGDEAKFALHNLIPYPGANNIYNLKVVKTKYTNETSICREGTYFNKCMVKTILDASYNCTNWCLPLSLPQYDSFDYFPQCQTWEEYACMKDNVENLFINEIYEKCPTACETVEYTGKVLHTIYLDESTFQWSYDISNRMTVYEEYVVYDFAGFISSVGGMIGLFIGFSFLDLILPCLNFISRNFCTKYK